MLGYWVASDSPHYVSFDGNQKIAYISDVGADKLKPLFIAGSSVMVVCLDLSMIAERWLRHKGRLAHNTSWFQKGLDIIAIFAAIVGAAGLIFLSIFDTKRYPRVHDGLLVVFIAGYIVSAIAICWEYQRLGIHFRERPVLRYSFWIKLVFIIVEIALAIGALPMAFGVENQKDQYNRAAVIEWVIALIFAGYILSFFIDLLPAVRHKPGSLNAADPEMAGVDHNSAESGYGLTNRTNGYYGDSGPAYGQAYTTNQTSPSHNF
ncbi:MAG: hypothetical protein M1820_000455 [Bogoriella megaspora]|nr:MAG: hypothetical protein M1820_000455 [Bogoriella megaspora]